MQPGWFPGHKKALFYVNIGIIESGMQAPPNYSHPVVGPLEVTGPNNTQYPGQFCYPQVRMPANITLSVGQNITIQVIEIAQHGAALYSVRFFPFSSFSLFIRPTSPFPLDHHLVVVWELC